MFKSRFSENRDKFNTKGEYKLMMETTEISPIQVLGTADHLAFVAADKSIYGMGYQVQNNDNAESECYRKIPFPEGLSGADIKKFHVGKFQRMIWTHDGRFFHNGRHKSYMWGPTKTSTNQEDKDRFCEMNKEWFRNGADPIVDWVAGNHYNAVITEAGKIICSGYRFWRRHDSEIRHNDENYEDWPFTLKPPAEEWKKAVAVFPSMKMQLLYCNWKKEDGTVRTFRGGN